MAPDDVFALEQFPVHLGLGARATRQEQFTGAMEWYEAYAARTADDGAEGRMVAMHTFRDSWTTWERHPHGEELVVCTAGHVTLHQEIDGAVVTAKLVAGEATINPAGVWHTADTDGEVTLLFVTPGMGTDHRPR